jgi:hypothetical protein
MVAHRRVCLPVGARLWQPGGPSKLDLAGVLVGLLAARYPDRQFHLAGDAAYAGKTLRGLPERVSVTTRLRSDAALYALPGPRRPGQRGRPRLKGDRLPELIVLAALVRVRWRQAAVWCYDTKHPKQLASLVCLWPTVFGAQPVRVVLVRPVGAPDGSATAAPKTSSLRRSGPTTASRPGCGRWWSRRSPIWATRGCCAAGAGCCTASGRCSAPLGC